MKAATKDLVNNRACGARVRRECDRIIDAANELDWVTQDMVIDILRDEQAHRRMFEGFLREYEGQRG